jgi:pyridoxal/pyridoxine/pyridoxamine kinase
VYGLQARHIEVDPLITCQFSNHTGYDSWKGFKVNGDQLTTTITGLSDNTLLPQYTHVLTGYIAEQSFIEQLAPVIARLKASRKQYLTDLSQLQHKNHPNLSQTATQQQDDRVIVLCDPVLGDDGHLYVPQTFTQTYTEKIIPLADIITPNETELEHLAGIPISSQDDVVRASSLLHDMGPPLIIVTSLKDHFSSSKQEQSYSISIPPQTDDFYTRSVIGYPHQNDLSSQWVQYVSKTAETLPIPDRSTFAASLLSTPLQTLDYSVPKCLADAVNDKLQYQGTICSYISFKCKKTGTISSWVLRLPRFNQYIAGTGDLTASLILAHLQQFDNTSMDEPEQIVTAISRAFATIHIVVRAAILRSGVCSHIQNCAHCFALQHHNNLSKAIPFHPLPTPAVNGKDAFDIAQYINSLMDEYKQTPQQQARIAAPYIPGPLELWLPGVHHEFTNPTCTITPNRIL